MGSADASEGLPGKDDLPAGRRYRAIDWATFLLLVVALIYWAAFVFFVLPQTFRGQSSDFTSYYAAALALRQHATANIYDLALLRQVMGNSACTGSFAEYLYPPVLAILVQPLTLLPCNLATGLWLLLNGALWLASALLLTRWLPSILPAAPSARWDRWLRRGIVILCLVSVPLIDALILGQVNFIVLFALVLIPWLIQRDKPILAGGALALIAMIKVLPAFLILYYVARGRWRVVIGAALGSAFLLGLTMLTIGVPDTWSGFARLFAWGSGVDPPHNEALAQLPLWFTLSSGNPPGPFTRILMVMLPGLVALAFVAGVIAIRPPRSARPASLEGNLTTSAPLEEVLGYGWAICTMLLLTPLVWFHYNGWLLVPLLYGLAVTLRCLSLRQRQTWLIVFLLVVAALFTSFPLPFDVDNQGTNAQTPFVLGIPLWLVLLLTRPLGTLLLWGILYKLWWSVSRTANTPAPLSISGYSPAALPRSARRGDG